MELARVLRIDTKCEEHRFLLQAIKEVFYEPGCWRNGSGERKNSSKSHKFTVLFAQLTLIRLLHLVMAATSKLLNWQLDILCNNC
jgi:hypothetical protein